MGFLDSIFDRDKQEAPVSLMTPEQQSTQKTLLQQSTPMASDYLNKVGQGYPGEMITSYEQQGLNRLGDYLNQPDASQDALYGQAKDELSKTLGGEYDVGGTYYDAYKKAVMRELQDAKDRLNASTSARDTYWGGGRISETGRLEEGAVNNLAMTLGQLYENERGRKLGAVDQAQSLLGFGQQAPLQQIAASQQYGGLPFTREYSEYIRQMEELGIPLDVALQLATTKNEYYQPGYEPSLFESAIAPLLGAGMQAAGSYYGGKAGGKAIANALQ